MDVTDLKEELLLLRKENAELQRTDSAETEGQGEIMTEQRRITDELRKLVRDGKGSLLAIADRIDATHQKAEDDWKAKDGQTWLRGYGECHAELMEGNEVIAADLEKAGWYRVVDADKQPIRFNDDMEWELLGSGETERGYVVGIKIDLIADRQSFRVKVVRDSDFQTIELMAKNLHHVKPAEAEPTVEDVLREFADELRRCCDTADTINEYAAKLRLRGDVE